MQLRSLGFILLPAVLATRYLVQLKPDSSLSQLLEDDDKIQAQTNLRTSVVTSYTIGETFKCFSADLDENAVNILRSSSFVYDIVPDFKVHAYPVIQQEGAVTSENLKADEDEGDDEEDTDTPVAVKVQQNAPRHLARLSSREPIGSGPDLKYHYGETGKGVVAYVLDSGVAIDHPELEGRASTGPKLVDGDIDAIVGHGTHVAGIIGSKTYGVAKDVEIVDVQVLDALGGGTFSTVIAGIEYASKDRAARKVKGVANLSLGSIYVGILNDAVDAASKTGLVVVAAAGNSASRADWFSPASAEGAITVAALNDTDDSIAFFSNYGAKVDVFASGVQVESLSALDYNISVRLSGTSMAAPVVAGLAATFLEAGVPFDSLQEFITKTSTKDAVSYGSRWLERFPRRHTPNRLAYNTFGKDLAESSDFHGEQFDEDDNAWNWSQQSAQVRGINLDF